MKKLRTIYLKAGLKDSLDFQSEQLLCKEAVLQGDQLRFDIDLGLFSSLKKPLSHQSQFLSLELSLEHFKNTLWNEFQENIIEVCLYSGDLDFAFQPDPLLDQNFQGWMKELNIETDHLSLVDQDFIYSLFCRDVALDYLHMLRANLPDIMPLSIRLDDLKVRDPLQRALLTNKEVYEPFQLFLSSQTDTKPTIAICLPSSKKVLLSEYEAFSQALDYLVKNDMPYRLIPESMLISEWDLVDYLFVLPHLLEAQGKRKLQGFCAAGGIVVTLGIPLGLAQELSFTEFQNKLHNTML